MGDVYKDIHNSILTTRGSIAEGIVLVRMHNEENVANSLKTLDELIASAAESELSSEKKKECLELLCALTNEAKKQHLVSQFLKRLASHF